MNFSMRNRLMATTMVGGAFAAALVSAAAAMADDAPVQEIVVTGTRLKTTQANSISPVTVVGAADIQSSGVTNVEDLLNQLPQVFADQSGTVAGGGATGTATLNLRGLGCQRTLVLVDGKRLNAGDGGYLCADLNFIPSALIERVEILTGGASTTYGADAVGGVANFVMQKSFQGVKLDIQQSDYMHQNNDRGVQGIISQFSAANPNQYAEPKNNVQTGRKTEISVVIGGQTNDGKGSLEVYATYAQAAAIIQHSYDYSECALGSTSTYLTCSGSSTGANGKFHFLEPNNPNLSGNYVVDPSGSGKFVGYSGARDSFNYGAYTYFQRPDERYTAGAFAHYELNSHADVYSQFMFLDDNTTGQQAPSALFFGGQNVVPCSSAVFTTQELAQVCPNGGANNATPGYVTLQAARRNVEGGVRDWTNHHIDFRLVQGVKGEIVDGWTYDISAQVGHVTNSQYTAGELSLSKIANALNVVNVNGVATCESVINGTDPSCVPWNIFKVGGVTPAAINYISVPILTNNSVTEQIVTASTTGDLGKYGVKSPWAKDSVAVNLGIEYRRETASTTFDQEQLSGDDSDLGGTPVYDTKGSYNVSEAFGEAQIPILQNLPFAQTLSLSTGVRTSDYNLSGRQNTWKAGVIWAPVKELHIRYSFQDAIRAPNVNELFSANVSGLVFLNDPCAYNGTATLQQCEATGLTAAQYAKEKASNANSSALFDSALQYNVLGGGNEHLKPEESATNSFGFTWSPKAGADISLDWFDIKIDHVIQGANAQGLLDGCVSGASADCAAIHRSPTDGSLWTLGGYVSTALTNLGSLHTRGVDLDANYRIALPKVMGADIGSIKTHISGTFLMMLKTDPSLGSPAYDCRERYGATCGNPNFVWRHRATATWNTPWKVAITGAWRYYSGVKDDNNTDAPADLKIKQQQYFDLSANYRLTDKLTLRVGADNIFDRDPPLIGDYGTGNGNTYPTVYDSLGRYVFAGIKAEF